jgi:D-apionolactonase
VLTAGALSAEFVGGNLRDIRFDGVEVIRAIGYTVRDRDLCTYAPNLSNMKIHHEAESFEIRSALRGRRRRRRFAPLRVIATPVGDCETNRCGFCVLHPIVCVAGSPIVIEHVDGSRENTYLPDLVYPWQPFT